MSDGATYMPPGDAAPEVAANDDGTANVEAIAGARARMNLRNEIAARVALDLVNQAGRDSALSLALCPAHAKRSAALCLAHAVLADAYLDADPFELATALDLLVKQVVDTILAIATATKINEAAPPTGSTH